LRPQGRRRAADRGTLSEAKGRRNGMRNCGRGDSEGGSNWNVNK